MESTLKTHMVRSKEKFTTVNFLSDVRQSILKPLLDSRWLRIDQEEFKKTVELCANSGWGSWGCVDGAGVFA